MRTWIVMPLGLAMMTAACGETREQRATTGAVGGAVAGAAVGGPVGALVGAGAGAAGGAYRETIEDKSDEFVDNKAEDLATADRNAQAANRNTMAENRMSGDRLTNQEVREAQTALQDMGLYNGQIDGLYGPRTISAVGQYQNRNDLPQTYALDGRTLQQLQAHASTAQNQGSGQNAGMGSQNAGSQNAGSSSGNANAAGAQSGSQVSETPDSGSSPSDKPGASNAGSNQAPPNQ